MAGNGVGLWGELFIIEGVNIRKVPSTLIIILLGILHSYLKYKLIVLATYVSIENI